MLTKEDSRAAPSPVPPPNKLKTSKFELVAERGEAVASREYPNPALSIDIPLKVARPSTAVTGVVPLKVPEAGLLSMAKATEALDRLENAANLPAASRISTSTVKLWLGATLKVTGLDVITICVAT